MGRRKFKAGDIWSKQKGMSVKKPEEKECEGGLSMGRARLTKTLKHLNGKRVKRRGPEKCLYGGRQTYLSKGRRLEKVVAA